MVHQLLDRYFRANPTNGYVTLVSVVILGVVAMSIAISTLVISTDSLIANKSVEEARLARGLIDTCVEEALDEIQGNTFFTGTNNVIVGEGDCDYIVSNSENYSNILTYELDETVGATTFTDETPYGNDGTCMSGTRCPTSEVTGQCGTAVNFDGSDDIIELSDNDSIDLSAGSISLWFRAENISSFDTILSKASFDEGVGAGDLAYMIYFRPGSFLTASTYQSVNSTLAIQAFGGTSVSLNTWHHVVATWDETGIHLYLDGDVDAYNSNSALSRITDAGLQIGQRFSDDNIYAFDGQVDRVQIWNRKISEAEVLDLFENCPEDSELSSELIEKVVEVTATIGDTTRKARIDAIASDSAGVSLIKWQEIADF